MIYINTKKIINHDLKSLLQEIYGSRLKEIDFIHVDEIGKLVNNYILISKSKIIKINPNIHNINKIKDSVTPDELSIRIINQKLENIDFDDYIENNKVKSIYIENSNIKEIRINQKIKEEGTIYLEIKNSKILHAYINLFRKISNNQSFKVKHTFSNLETDLIFIESENQNVTNLENIKTSILKIYTESAEITNCSFAFPIILNKSKTKIDVKDCDLIFSKESKIILRNLIENRHTSNISYSQILSSLRYLNTLNDSDFFKRNLERIYAFIDSKRNFATNFLYNYTEYYYNYQYPFLGIIICFLIFQAFCQSQNINNFNLEISYIFRPLEFTKEILLKDFKLSLNFHNISFTKIILGIMSIIFYYSSFSFFLAIKKNLGYRKIN
ncbi:hypothetical protein [Leptospira bandrabouensis]|uniref:Uncharacterized protein n=1 Tax=Leptospira bandrabouensis TaxID=2484903 RepID=A0A6H3NQR1_9LEPT|nr:hypothetical protein [Leptospira bandrabouensis]MCG6154095.1 hypothetical protein [Leptospira bandrabouensis]TGN09442.1 hypothetical protein EHR07_01395 [Leptospira bandrabouensis]TGN11583.1 hypothetical protein EHR08_17210 [Leptospira bandrabouensis]